MRDAMVQNQLVEIKKNMSHTTDYYQSNHQQYGYAGSTPIYPG